MPSVSTIISLFCATESRNGSAASCMPAKMCVPPLASKVEISRMIPSRLEAWVTIWSSCSAARCFESWVPSASASLISSSGLRNRASTWPSRAVSPGSSSTPVSCAGSGSETATRCTGSTVTKPVSWTRLTGSGSRKNPTTNSTSTVSVM